MKIIQPNNIFSSYKEKAKTESGFVFIKNNVFKSYLYALKSQKDFCITDSDDFILNGLFYGSTQFKKSIKNCGKNDSRQQGERNRYPRMAMISSILSRETMSVKHCHRSCVISVIFLK